ncbi:MAG: SpoIIE family protein phosphatase [Clostridia bacterium]|nr:SpoIIE family protein phosphatase [Clostridia bacterium]
MKNPVEKVKDYYLKKEKAYRSEVLFHDNEVQANRAMFNVLLISGILLVMVWAAVRVHLFPVTGRIIDHATIFGSLQILAAAVVCRAVRNDAWWLKYFLLVLLIVVYARLDGMLTHKVAILMVIPVICSSRYFSRTLTKLVSYLTVAVFAFSTYFGAVKGWIDLNNVTLPVGTVLTLTDNWIASGLNEVSYDVGTYVRNSYLFSFLPRCLMFVISAVISADIASRGRKMVLAQKTMTENNTRIETELQLAKGIQAAMLPDPFPPFSGHGEIDICASMAPAREVGGDFYDFFFIDDNHLALVIADVSGKGVPAALFMMSARIMIRDGTLAGGSPADILSSVNRRITANNKAEMFVTVWLGILDTATGTIRAANAGHEYPAVFKGGQFTLFREKHGLPVGTIEGTQYTEYNLVLGQGDILFLYTDGVTEATDREKKLFGTERMLRSLNRKPGADPEKLLDIVRTDVARFVQNAPQFDDMTMLCIRYNGSSPSI